MILAMDTFKLKKLDKGEDLIEVSKFAKEVARESQERVY